MKTSAKKLFSLTLALVMVFALFTTAVTVNAEEADLGKVSVIIKNETFSTADSAAWEGCLIQQSYHLKSDSTMLSVVEDVLKENNISYSLNSYGYISDINGLSEYACNGSGGWMITLNDWFTTEGAASYSVEKGSLLDKDVITVQYSCTWGSDIGSLWDNTDTSLKSVFVDRTYLDREFKPSETEYTLKLNCNHETNIALIPEAFNKNYQVRTYLNSYTPEKEGLKVIGNVITVKPGDVIYVGVGNENWPSMNAKTQETVYKFTVEFTPLNGDTNLDGIVDIDDATFVQKHLAGLIKFNDEQIKTADADGDGELTIHDATAIQKIVAHLI